MMMRCGLLCVSLCCFFCISCANTCSYEQKVCGMVGQDIELNCSLEKEKSSVTWSKGRDDLSIDNNNNNNEKYQIVKIKRYYNLIIKNSSFDDSGNYSCVTNINGTQYKDCKYVAIEDYYTDVTNIPRTNERKPKQHTDEKTKDFKFRYILLYIGICGFISLFALSAIFCLRLMKRFQVTCNRENPVEAVEMDEARHYTEVEVDEVDVQL